MFSIIIHDIIISSSILLLLLLVVVVGAGALEGRPNVLNSTLISSKK